MISGKVVSIVLLLVAFLFVFFFVLYLKPSSSKDICHFSVLSRGSISENAQSIVPLRCTTEKICLSSGEDCSVFSGEKGVQRVSLGGDSLQAARVIEKSIADSMLDCWTTMGEGKLDIFSEGVLAHYNLKPSSVGCLICSRLGFSLRENQKEEVLRNVNIQRYLQTTQVYGGRYTYLEHFLGPGVKTFVAPTKETLELQGRAVGGTDSGVKIVPFGSGLDEMAVVFTQIHTDTSKGVFDKLIQLGATAGGLVLISPVGRVATKSFLTLPGLLVGGVAAAGVTIYAFDNAYQGRVTAATYCGPFVSDTQKSGEGCSVVQVVPYDKNTINQLCGYIEGNP